MPKTPKSLLLGAALAAALAIAPGTAAASPGAGDPDPGFDNDGRLVVPYDIQPAAVLVQPDGKLVVPDSTSFRVLRLNSDGSPDRGFDGDGIASADFGAGAKILSAALQPDGKLLLGGKTAALDSALVRLNATGSLDRSFSPGGADGDGKKINGLAVSQPSAIVVEAGGRIVVFGQDSFGATATRLTSAGSPDGTIFEAAGGSVTAAAPGNGGTLLVAGFSYRSGSSDRDLFVARWRADGKLDTTLAGKGWSDLGSPTVDEKAFGVLAQPDGKPVLAADTGISERKMGLTRLTATGAPDGTFGDSGFAAPDFDGDDVPVGAGLQSDGKLLIAGATHPGLQFAAARYTPEGALDPAYGDGGRTTVGFDDLAVAQAAALQPDGKLVIAGWTAVENRTKMRTALVRLLAEDPPASGDGGSGGQSGGGGKAPDTTLSFALTGAKRQRLVRHGAIRVRLQSPREDSTAVVSAFGRVRGTRLQLRPRSIAVAAGPARTVVLRLTRKQRRVLRAALATGKRPQLTVTAKARDAAGNTVRQTLRVTAKR